MPPLRRKRKSRIVAPATLLYHVETKDGVQRPSLYAQCHYSGQLVGPILGHGARSVSEVFRSLNTKCDCGRRYHKQIEVLGTPLVPR